jgi:hypothetical protein
MVRIDRSFDSLPLRFLGFRSAAVTRWRRQLHRAAQALGAGASTIPFGDNGDVFRALSHARSDDHQRAQADRVTGRGN